MKKRISAILILSLLFCGAVFAMEDDYQLVTITNYSNGDTEYSYNDSLKSSKYTFEGEISRDDCQKVRVLWSPDGFKAIERYLITGKTNAGDKPVDDFYLKQYKAGSKTFAYNVSGAFDNLVYGSNYYKFIAYFKDGSVDYYDFTFYVYNGGAAERAKPVIYLYPKKPQKVRVKVEPKGGVTESIPDYDKGWTVFATSESELTDLNPKAARGTETYPYLYWESKDNGEEIDMSEGFVVETKKLKSFFEEKLKILGLNDKEIADFVEYWIPELQGKKYVFITFHSQEKINKDAPLTISPKPDSVIRVYFDHKKLDKKISVKEQTLTTPERKGFTVVEWGGRRYK